IPSPALELGFSSVFRPSSAAKRVVFFQFRMELNIENAIELEPVTLDSLGEMRKQRSRSRIATRERTGAIASSTASWRQLTRTITDKLSSKKRQRNSAQGRIRVDVTCDGR